MLMMRFLSKVHIDASTGCWNWTASKLPSGYGRINIDQKIKRAHRVGYELFRGKIPEGLEALHKCDRPQCVNPFHIFLGTKQDNVQDMIRKNRHNPKRGESNYWSKLNEKQVVEIRNLYANGNYTYRQLAATYNLGKTTVEGIIRHKKWAHI